MSRATSMTLLGAVDAIGDYLADISPNTWVKNRRGETQAHYPVPNVFVNQPGAPALRVRWSGAPEETNGGLESAEVPQTLFFELRVTHPYIGQQGQDSYITAQRQVAVGLDALNSHVHHNPTLGGLVMEARKGAMNLGNLIDEDGNQAYGGEIQLICDIH